LGPLERASLNHCPIHLRTETDPVSETLWDFLSSTYKTMDRVQNKPNSSMQEVVIILVYLFCYQLVVICDFILNYKICNSNWRPFQFRENCLNELQIIAAMWV
jgi:hypothetical protein